MSKKAIVVLSGGQDSTACLVWAQRQGYQVEALTFYYGQRHELEILAASDVALLCGVERHEILKVGPILNGTSPLTNKSETLETYMDFQSMDSIIGNRVEKTFVPMRNALFLTLAANRAVCQGADTIITGVCQADNANYPDCREPFIHAQQQTINQALGLDHLRIVTPLMHISKSEAIVEMADHGDLPLLAWTHTAYDGLYPPTGQDHASVLRAQSFVEAEWPDPLVVRAYMEGKMALPTTANYANLSLIESIYDEVVKQRRRLEDLKFAAMKKMQA